MARDAIRRLCKDLEQLERSNNPQLTVRPSEESMLEWHFAVHHLPDDTVYAGGCYHGKIIFPKMYPLSPPALVMLTPSGRFEVNKRLCISMTDFHPESWNPAWTVESILVGLISFMVDERETRSIGAMLEPPEVRQRLAATSAEFNRSSPEFCALFPELAVGQATQHPHQPLSAVLGGGGAQEDPGPGRPNGAPRRRPRRATLLWQRLTGRGSQRPSPRPHSPAPAQKATRPPTGGPPRKSGPARRPPVAR
ncbi:unnamed protein product [Prorocentrum cordatum]|uniref:UBC core domain-containing protein n=1 Tax=Prorocentrum cordatum TaxID=2364126 RepID=A0ABN9QQU4_9DINO|nr:unnamed protein product [Polarella glacialis]